MMTETDVSLLILVRRRRAPQHTPSIIVGAVTVDTAFHIWLPLDVPFSTQTLLRAYYNERLFADIRLRRGLLLSYSN